MTSEMLLRSRWQQLGLSNQLTAAPKKGHNMQKYIAALLTVITLSHLFLVWHFATHQDAKGTYAALTAYGIDESIDKANAELRAGK